MFHVKQSDDWRNGGFGLYLHWPFCASKCPYCDFNSHVSARIDQHRWREAYLSEIERLGSETQGRVLQTVFFGGGTPSLMDPDLVGAILEAVRKTWPTTNDWEVTLEANPGSVEAGRFSAFLHAGINRVSLGIQSLNDNDLARLGRRHTAREARTALDIALATFDRVSFDLIYARQGQTLADWNSELCEAVGMAVDHLSLYQLTIEDGTPFAALHRTGKLRGLPDEDLAADLFLLTQDVCGEAGLPAYEVSNHARPGSESRHNRIYWSAGDYVGIGPGAHGRLTFSDGRYSTETHRMPDAWLKAVESGLPADLRVQLSAEEQALEYLMMGLRLTEGIDLARLQRILGQDLDPQPITELVSLEKVALAGERLYVTPQGRLVLNAVISSLSTAWT